MGLDVVLAGPSVVRTRGLHKIRRHPRKRVIQ